MSSATRTVRMDKVGRVVIPKAAREYLGLADGGQLEIELHNGEVKLRPVSQGHLVRGADGWLVWDSGTGQTLTHEKVEETRRRIWEERINDAWNPKG